MTWVDMEQAIQALQYADQQWRLMFVVLLLVLCGAWLTISTLAHQVHALRRRGPQPVWFTLLDIAFSASAFALAAVLWWRG